MEILKNFSTINSSILIQEGNTIRTVSQAKDCMGEATVDETFECDFGIWDLRQFLSVVGMFSEPEFEFNDKFVQIRSGGKASIRYYASAKDLFYVPKTIVMPPSVYSFTMEKKYIAELSKAAHYLGADTMVVETRDDRVVVRAVAKKNPTSHDYAIDVGDAGDEKFNFAMSVENLRFLPDDYTFSFCEKKIAQITAASQSLKYWITLGADSTYETKVGSKGKAHAAAR
jgi:hypothetical protein